VTVTFGIEGKNSVIPKLQSMAFSPPTGRKRRFTARWNLDVSELPMEHARGVAPAARRLGRQRLAGDLVESPPAVFRPSHESSACRSAVAAADSNTNERRDGLAGVPNPLSAA
jgi:hypothetical protein